MSTLRTILQSDFPEYLPLDRLFMKFERRRRHDKKLRSVSLAFLNYIGWYGIQRSCSGHAFCPEMEVFASHDEKKPYFVRSKNLL